MNVIEIVVHSSVLMGSTLITNQCNSKKIYTYNKNYIHINLKQSLVFCGCHTSTFKGHSFVIGVATDVALRGDSDATIRAAGRWTYDANKTYIRIAQ